MNFHCGTTAIPSESSFRVMLHIVYTIYWYYVVWVCKFDHLQSSRIDHEYYEGILDLLLQFPVYLTIQSLHLWAIQVS